MKAGGRCSGASRLYCRSLPHSTTSTGREDIFSPSITARHVLAGREAVMRPTTSARLAQTAHGGGTDRRSAVLSPQHDKHREHRQAGRRGDHHFITTARLALTAHSGGVEPPLAFAMDGELESGGAGLQQRRQGEVACSGGGREGQACRCCCRKGLACSSGGREVVACSGGVREGLARRSGSRDGQACSTGTREGRKGRVSLWRLGGDGEGGAVGESAAVLLCKAVP